MTPIILTPKKVSISHSELTPKNGVTVTLYILQCIVSEGLMLTELRYKEKEML